MTITIIDKSSSQRSRPSASIITKGTKEYYKNTPQKSSGPREACEDITCMECNQYITQKNYDGYKKCKQKCFYEKREQIMDCCLRSCDNLGSKGGSECVKACETELKFRN
jgi:hypothetical protein